MPKPNYYVTNDELIAELKQYDKTGVISNELGKMFLDIARNLSNKGNFSGYSWKRDMIGEAVYTCVRYVYNFDINKQKKPNPFAYFSRICYNCFLGYIKKQKTHSKIKDRCYNNAYTLSEKDQYIEKAIDYESLK